MRKLLPFLLSLFLIAPSPVSKLDRSLFRMLVETSDGVEFGTGFCAPGKSNLILTASHVIGTGLVVIDSKGVPHTEVKVLLNDPKRDIGVLMLDGNACELSPLEFAAKDASPGDDAFLEGWGGGFTKLVATRGMIASEPGYEGKMNNFQLAQLNALFGHSGSPVVGSDGKVIGMLVGVWKAEGVGDEMDVIVPLSELKRALR